MSFTIHKNTFETHIVLMRFFYGFLCFIRLKTLDKNKRGGGHFLTLNKERSRIMSSYIVPLRDIINIS